VDVRLSDEQQLLCATVARLGAQHAITDVRDLPPTPTAIAPAWDALEQAGLLGLDGPGAGVATALVAEQLAAAGCWVPYIGRGVLGPALGGDGRECVLLSADLSGFGDAVAFDVLGATDGLTADAAGGVTRRALGAPDELLDLSRGYARASGAGAAAGSIRSTERLLAWAQTLVAADQVGVMQRALNLAVSYAKERRQFGRVIGANQALAHLLADAAVVVEAARSSVWHAAWAVDVLEPAAAAAAARQAKAFCGRVGRDVVETAIQAHGGIAITWEHQLHVLLRRMLADTQLFGAPERLYPLIATDPVADPVPLEAADGLEFADSPQEAAFRSQVRGWLAAHAPHIDTDDPDERMAQLHAWHQAMARAGYVGVAFPKKYGGQGFSLLHEAVVNDELAAVGAPAGPAHNHITNAIRLFGTEEQKRTYLPGLLDCTVRWCQGFSEPQAGSDLAALTTRGSRFSAGGCDSYRIDGQKLWTSEAVWAQWCLLLLRTETGGRPHEQLSMLMVPMSTPGLECRPVRTAYGSSEFAEVFFDGAVVPATQLLGRPGQGWEIAMALLGFERGPADMGWTARLRRTLNLAWGLDPIRLAPARVELEALRWQVLRSTCRRLDGSAPGPEGSLDKLLVTRVEQQLNHALLDIAGPDFLADPAAFSGYIWSRAQSIFGGTSQIQRDIVAQRVLGLPRFPK
jgi:alkylation response protein AidB-like acyl-CoA dehydrogenase